MLVAFQPAWASFLATRSAPCLVRTNTRKLPSSDRNKCSNRESFRSALTSKVCHPAFSCGLEHRADLDPNGISQVLARDFAHRAFEGCGKTECLVNSGNG